MPRPCGQKPGSPNVSFIAAVSSLCCIAYLHTLRNIPSTQVPGTAPRWPVQAREQLPAVPNSPFAQLDRLIQVSSSDSDNRAAWEATTNFLEEPNVAASRTFRVNVQMSFRVCRHPETRMISRGGPLISRNPVVVPQPTVSHRPGPTEIPTPGVPAHRSPVRAKRPSPTPPVPQQSMSRLQESAGHVGTRTTPTADTASAAHPIARRLCK